MIRLVMAESAHNARFPIQASGVLDSPRHSAVVRVTHWIVTLGFFGLVVSGVAILLAHPRLYWGEDGAVGAPSLLDLPLPFVLVGQSGWGRSLHFVSAWVCVLSGVVYILSGLFTKHFLINLLPAKATLAWRPLWRVVSNHLRLRPAAEGGRSYNIVQRLAYLSVVFLLFPLIVIAGLAMSPAVVSVAPVIVTVFGGQQSARTVHFFAASLLVLFFLVHVLMVSISGFANRVRPMIAAGRADREGAHASAMLPRRNLIATGLATAGGASGLAVAAYLVDRYGLIPPDHGGIYGAGETLTYAAQRVLMSGHSLAREFNRSQISKAIPVNGPPPENMSYLIHRTSDFVNWRLAVDGLVARPSSFSLEDLKRFPSRSQITHQACEEGWSFIAEWTGVPLSHVLNVAGVHPRARYVVFFPFDESWDSLDMSDAWHPQTLLAYGMNGQDLPAPHGAPLRLKVPRQLGYKNVKYLSRVIVTDTLKNIGKGLGSSSPEIGYSWYAGI
ncbi:MAG TPA: molybdopterin-dependent oxidoreductase [Bryobacteraceae bacterium]|nr:molybdopterin-dependent oxidoreductase [Bryobacteraceae bacterium]